MAVLRYLGLAQEPAYNPDIKPAAAFHVDMASATLDAPTDTELLYAGGLGRSTRTRRPGFYTPSGNFEYAFDIRTIGWLIKWALGGYTFTTGVPLNLHELYGTDNLLLPSFTARVGKDHFEHVFGGCVINSLEIAVEGEFANVTADIMSAVDNSATLVQLENLLLPEEYPLAFHEVTSSLGASDISCEVKSLTLTIENNLDAEAGRGLGQRHPCRIIAGERNVTFSADLFYKDKAMLEKFWGSATGPAQDGSEEFDFTIDFNSGTFGDMTIYLPRTIFTQVQQQPTGRDEIVQSVEATALANTITLEDTSEIDGEILVSLRNNESTMA